MEKFKTGASILTASIAIAFLSHCSPKKAEEAAIVQLLDEGMVSAHKVLNRDVRYILEQLDEKSRDPASAYKAQIWLPKANEIHLRSGKMYAYVEALKSNLMNSSGNKSQREFLNDHEKINTLYDSLLMYKQEILQVDTLLGQTFSQHHLVLISNNFDSQYNKEKKFTSYFRNITMPEAISILNRVQFNILNNENRLISFCNEQVSKAFCGIKMYSAIVAQSSKYVRAGETMEIIAGVGAFSREAKPIFTIQNKNVLIDEYGTAIFRFKAPRKPGKHAVPVKINFIDGIGMPQEIIKNVEYTVAKEQD